jgi:low affinity Fe/Cu permease
MGNLLTNLGVQLARPGAFLLVFAYTAAWFFIEPHSLDWHGAAAIATLLMTLVIQRSEHRDTQALHAKLDALIRAQDGVANNVTTIDDEEPEAIEAKRSQAQASDRPSAAARG